MEDISNHTEPVSVEVEQSGQIISFVKQTLLMLIMAILGCAVMGLGLFLYHYNLSQQNVQPEVNVQYLGEEVQLSHQNDQKLITAIAYCVMAIGGIFFLASTTSIVKTIRNNGREQRMLRSRTENRDVVDLDDLKVVYDEELASYFIEAQYVDKSRITYVYRFGCDYSEDYLNNFVKENSKVQISIDARNPRNCQMVDADQFTFSPNRYNVPSSENVGALIVVLVFVGFGFLIRLFETIINQAGEVGLFSMFIWALSSIFVVVYVISLYRSFVRRRRYGHHSTELAVTQMVVYVGVVRHGKYSLATVAVNYDSAEGRVVCRSKPFYKSMLNRINYFGQISGTVFLDKNELRLS